MRTLLTATFLALALGACGTAGEASIPEGDWVAVSGVSDGANVELIDEFAVTVNLGDDQIVGTAACNRYSGLVEIGSDGSFEASDLSWTEIGCEPAVMGVEQAYLASLGRFTEYRLGDGFLTLVSATDEWVFTQVVGAGT